MRNEANTFLRMAVDLMRARFEHMRRFLLMRVHRHEHIMSKP